MPVLAQETADLLPVTEAYKLSADASTPGTLKLHWTIAQDYYLYRGRMKFTAGDGVKLGVAQLPDGEKHHDEYLGDVETYHHGVDASLPYTVAAGTHRLTLRVQYQGCHEVDPKICYPPHPEKLDLALPAAAADAAAAPPVNAGTGPGAAFQPLGNRPAAAPAMDGAALPDEQAFRFEALAQDAHHLLLRWTMPKGYYLYRDQTSLKLVDTSGLTLGKLQWPAGTPHHDDHYGDVTVFFGQVDVPVGIDGSTSGLGTLKLAITFQGCQQGGICYPPMSRTVDIPMGGNEAGTAKAGGATFAAAAASAGTSLVSQTPPAPNLTIWLLLGALSGGLLLNLMPCVLPVLSLKVLGVLENSSEAKSLRRHAVFYTIGVLLSFAVLDVIAHIFGRSLGAQLQTPIVVAILACVMLAVGLSLSGLYQFGASLSNTGQSLAARKGPLGDFFTGVLAVVVASPCTGPLMGPPIAYAFGAPLTQSLFVFLTLGLGLALPIILIAVMPTLARLLPRPGAWMETLKQALAFPMYLTAVWLVWVLAKQRGADAVLLVLVAGTLLAAALWWFEHSRYSGAVSKSLVVVLGLLAAAPLVYVSQLPSTAEAPATTAGSAVPYTPEKLAELRKAGTPVFVDMTADWCVTCKANEHTVLDTNAFRGLLKRTGAVYMKGDWTDVDPTIEAFLQQYHSPGVPLYVVFPKNGGAGRQLSTVLTPSLVDDALTEAAH